MKRTTQTLLALSLASLCTLTCITNAHAQEAAATDADQAAELAKKLQNPVAALISVPFQSNTNFNSGPFNRTQEILNIQPVVPMHLNENWNVISRTNLSRTGPPASSWARVA